MSEAEVEAEAKPAPEVEAEAPAPAEEAAEEVGTEEGTGLTEDDAAVVIGKYAKGYVARKEVQRYKAELAEIKLAAQLEKEEKAASLIGAAAKGRIERKKYMERKKENAGNEGTQIDFEIALSRKFAMKKLEAMSGLPGLDRLEGDSFDVVATKKRVKAEVEAWSGGQCSDFLTSVTAMRPYSAAFSAINGKAILRMSINSLSSIGIKLFDHQRIVWAAVKELQDFCNNIEYVPADESI